MVEFAPQISLSNPKRYRRVKSGNLVPQEGRRVREGVSAISVPGRVH